MTVAAVTALPLAYLYEHGGQTIWAPGLVHTAIDSFKLVIVTASPTVTFSLLIIAVSLVVPMLVFAFPRRFLGAGADHAGLPARPPESTKGAPRGALRRQR